MESISSIHLFDVWQNDQLVYQRQERHLRLYGLTEEEIRIVEGLD